MFSWKALSQLAVMLSPLMATSALAATVTLEPKKDNTLYETVDGSLSNGSGQHLFVGRIATGAIRRAVLAFDVEANIPADATITAVTLTMNMSRTIAGATDVTLHRALKDWGEGTSDAAGQEGGGAASTTGDATWMHTFFATDTWTNPGGDFAPAATAVQSVAGIGSYTWSGAQMVADVQAWASQTTPNFGWIVLGDESVLSTAKRFDSGEHPTAARRPMLTIEYGPDPIPAMNGWGLAALAGVLLLAGSVAVARGLAADPT